MTGAAYDVVIVGSGVAGLAAALAAYEGGCRDILVAESEKVVGGASRLSGGIMIGAGSRMQREQGIEESLENAVAAYLAMNRFDVDAAPARRMVEESGATIDWLQEQGVVFRVLPRERASSVFSYLPLENQEDLVRSLSNEQVRGILDQMTPDDRTRLLEELPAEVTRKLLESLGARSVELVES